MFNNFYGFLTNQKLRQLNLFKYLATAEEYGKVHDASEVFHPDGHLTLDCDAEPVFVSVSDDADTKIVLYKNLFFIFSLNSELNDKIVQIYVKRPEDEWTFPVKEDGTFDYLNPSNVKVEVYVNYDVSVVKLGRSISRCYGDDYRYGAWNKTFYRTINSFVGIIENYTEINQIKIAYNK